MPDRTEKVQRLNEETAQYELPYISKSRVMQWQKNPENCYWLGFLLGDGTVTQHPNGTWRLKLSLSQSDSEHLHKFSNWFGGEYSIKEIDETGEISTSVYNQDKIKILMSLGVTPNKTENVTLPDVPHINDVIRGYSDADGYIGAPGGNGFRWSIASKSRKILEQIEQEVPVDGGSVIRNPTAGSYYLRYGGLEYADDIFDFLYPNGLTTEPALNRKMESAHSRAVWSLKKTRDKNLENYA